ncbi:MAG: class I SAM-dependent methyltransferase [Promethearchaeota archaeon]
MSRDQAWGEQKKMTMAKFYDRRYFQVISETYKHLTYQYVQRIVSAMVEACARKKDVLLDVGCGIGWLLEVGRNIGCDVTGIDIALSGIKVAKERLGNTNFVVSDAHFFPFRDKAFDVVSCVWLLEHVENPEQVLKEIFRVLSARGYAVVMSPSGELRASRRRSPKDTLFERFGEEEFGEEHYWEFSPMGLQHIVEKAGFAILERRGIYRFHYFNLFTFPFYKILSSILKRPMGQTSEGVTRKPFTLVRKPLLLLIQDFFKLFSRLEMRLGNKAPFNLFGIETLIVGRK